MTLGKIYTLSEVAEHLRLTNRAVAKIAKAHGLCMEAGRTLTFTESDIDGIKQAMRVAPKEAPKEAPEPAPKPPLSDYQLSKSLRELTRKRSKRPLAKRLPKEEFGED